MPLNERTYDLEEALQDVNDDMEDTLDELEKYEPGTPGFERLNERGALLETQRIGLEQSLEEWDATEVTLGELTAGEYAFVQKHAGDNPSEQAIRNLYVAVGTVDAPYCKDGNEETALAVADECRPGYVQWAERKINDQAAVGDTGNSKSWASLRQERLAQDA